jgi:ADP-ribose pyrophosphatase YjhB (NUDIX family)
MEILDVFQPGLIRGSEHLPFDPKKAYAYVEHPTEGWRVYLRSAVFIHSADRPFREDKFLVFRNAKKGHASNLWEPPKGQMEGKDFSRKSKVPLVALLAKSAMRETEEEGHLDSETLLNLKYTGIVFQSQEKDYPKNHFFQYHIFQAFLKDEEIAKAYDLFRWFEEHPKAYARMSRDKRETDAISFFDPKKTKLNPRWCPSIVFGYLTEIGKSNA